MKIENGDIFDIGQTVNGVSRFLWFNDKWYYFEDRLSREYEYDQKELTDTVSNVSGLENIVPLGNIFSSVDLRVEVEEIEYHSQAMGCGLEDKNITDRYEAMAYGWEQAMLRVNECME